MNEQVIAQHDPHEPLKTEQREKNWAQHAELIAALVSGALILAGWLLSGHQVLSV
ncbi:hypothetical protein, partial [Bacillus sp. RHF6]